MHFFEERVWLPARRRKAEPDQAEAWARLQALAPETLVRLGLKELPPQVVFPGEAWATLFLRDAKAQYEAAYEKPEDVEEDFVTLCGELKELRSSMAFSNFFGAYPEGKAIYRLNHSLVEALRSVKPPDDYPTEALSLPRRAVVIDITENTRRPDGLMFNMAVSVSYDLATGREAEGGLMLRFILFADFPGYGLMPLPLGDLDLEPGKTILESLRSVGDRYQVRIMALAKEVMETIAQPELKARAWEVYGKVKEFSYAKEDQRRSEQESLSEFGPDVVKEHSDGWRRMDWFGLAVNALLYIQGEEDVVRVVHPGARPTKTSSNPQKALRFKELAEPEIFEVGQRYAATIERWEIEEAESVMGEGSGRKVRPHMRSAHPHLYWVGPGKKDARVRFLKPIAVKGGTKEQEATVVVTPAN